jgi:glycosyltransferase involved in cell wall biosynthesis
MLADPGVLSETQLAPSSGHTVRVMHLIPRIGRASFGLGPVALNLAKSQWACGAEANIWCLDAEAEIAWAAGLVDLDLRAIRHFDRFGPSFLNFSPAMEAAATGDPGKSFDIFHQHSLWSGLSRVTNGWRRRSKRPTVIAPHGTLQTWALRRSWGKKRLALWAYERQNLTEAACLHALSLAEAESFRAFGLVNPIAVIPNGIAETWINSKGDGPAFRETFGIPEDRRVMLFLSRVTPIKGLPMLLEALCKLRVRLTDWTFVIAGVDEFNHLAEVRSKVADFDLDEHVRFVGPLYDQAKRDAFAAAELFVLPSLSEGAPLVILEALGAGVPVITTQASPWAALLEYGCGWWTPISRDGLAGALAAALACSASELGAMGQRGRLLVEAQYTWQKIGADLLAVYDWLLGRAGMPASIMLS